MKLLYCTLKEYIKKGNSYYSQGYEPFLLHEMVKHLDKLYLLVPIREGLCTGMTKLKKPSQLEISGSKMMLHPYIQEYIWSFGNLSKFKELQKKVDGVLVLLPSALSYIACISHIRKPLITLIRGNEQEVLKYRKNPLLRAFAKFGDAKIRKIAEKYIIKKSDAIICRNRAYKHELTHNYDFPESRIKVIPAGIDIKLFKPYSLNQREKIKSKIGMGEEKIIGFVAAEISKAKGADTLLEMFKRLRNKHPNLVLLLIGEDIHGLFRDQEGVLQYESVPYEKMPFLYNVMDIFVFPTRTEGAPKVVIEANSCGVPVVSTTVGEISDIIKNGKNGFIAGAEDVDELTEYCEKLLMDENLLEKMRLKAREIVVKNFNFDEYITKLTSFIKEIIKERS